MKSIFPIPRTAPRPGNALALAVFVGGGALLGHAGALVDTLTGGPSQFYPRTPYGYVDGNTASMAKFYTPYGIAVDHTGDLLFIADRDNHAIRQINLQTGQTLTFTRTQINKPVGVAIGGDGELYVLNRGNGTNGTVLQFDPVYGDLVKVKATGLVNAAGITADRTGNVYVTVRSNVLLKIDAADVITTVASNFPPGTSLHGIVAKRNGWIAACDAGRHGIYLINPATGVITTNSGFRGKGDFENPNNTASASTAKFNEPYGVTEAGDGSLVVSDRENHRVKVVLPSGAVTNLYGCHSNLWVQGPASQGIFPGWWDGTVAVPDLYGGVEARQPLGVAFAPDGTVYTTEIYYHIIRKVTSTSLPPPPPPPPPPPTTVVATTNYGLVTLTWSVVPGATNYNVKRSTSSGGPYTIIGSTAERNFTDANVINGRTYYYVISAVNAGGEGPNSVEVSATPPLPPVADPQIGYVDFPATANPPYTSVFFPVSSHEFYNDARIVIKGTPGTGTYYEYGFATNAALVPDPTPSSASVPSDYRNGLSPGQVSPYEVGQVAPFLTIKAIGAKADGSPNSAVVRSTFQFKTGNPVISGDNAASFTLSTITANAYLYYTLDGSDPSSTNPAAVYLGPLPSPTNVWTVSLAISSNTVFKVRAFRDNYQPSAIVSNLFLADKFVPNRITFGLANREPSSAFIARPGQYFYAPVTLQLQPGGETVYSLQFNVGVTNAPASPPVPPGAGIDFSSMLVSEVLKERANQNPPPNFGWYLTIPPFLMTTLSNAVGQALFVNTNNNLLGVGWLFRPSFEYIVQSNLQYLLDFDTTKHDLIRYSIAHDTLFDKKSGVVVVGAYSFQVPTNAALGDRYFIQLGSPSGTRDGVGAPGANVIIEAPATNQAVTVGIPRYLVGDVAPFRWLNAGDFGEGMLDNADVMQVYQSAILGLHIPPANSDLFRAMDSAGRRGVWNPVNQYFVAGAPYDSDDVIGGSDQTINEVAFGDEDLDVRDVFVTFRRSLDPSLVWFTRFWTNNQFVAITNANLAYNSNAPAMAPAMAAAGSTPGLRAATLALVAGDAVAAAGQTVTIPVTASIFGPRPLRVLGLNVTVRPLDGSPALTAAVTFNPAAALGAPTIGVRKHTTSYAGAWLNSTANGLTGNQTLGWLTVTLPANATPSSAYAISFDHASASPDGIVPFAKQVRAGLITLADRSASSWGDGIPDSWRLRYFGTLHNVLAAAQADADGDGMTNWEEFQAGTDPNDRASALRVLSQRQSSAVVIRWPSVAGKRYVLEQASSLFSGGWTAIATNLGTGGELQYTESNPTGSPRFYRVRVQD